MSLPEAVAMSRPEIADFGRAASLEWLMTNGLGSYAAGTVAMACTRRYHGLLVAALNPPVGRTVLLAKYDVAVDYRGVRYPLGSNEYLDGTIHPRGYRFLDSFTLRGQVPEWLWRMSDLVIRQRIWMPQGEQTTHLSLEVLAAGAPVTLTVTPLCTFRDYHSHGHVREGFAISLTKGGCVIDAGPAAVPFRLLAETMHFDAMPDWHHRFLHREERARGLDDSEDLLSPGIFRRELAEGEAVLLSATLGSASPPPTCSIEAELTRARRLIDARFTHAPEWIRQLVLAADQFLVSRGAQGTSVIAGFPWFADWGRDTMIALPGLTLATGRVEIARNVLETYARHVDQGMLPNRFPDDGTAPEYNTVDATLWFFNAIAACLAAGWDRAFAAQMYGVLVDILAKHQRGTRHGIAVDAADGLLRAGEPGVQLTWMDARADGREVTPRHGKPVEINALWQRALRVTAMIAGRLGRQAEEKRYTALAMAHVEAFRARYWHTAGWLYDVVDGPDGADDASLRPNQIFAVALTPDLLPADHAKAVVDCCVRELWTPGGVRSLAAGDSAYEGSYTGGPASRDARYHQGTAWAWLLGPLAQAHFAVHRSTAQALTLLEPIGMHLREAGLGSIGEICDGDAPHAPRGCVAQAWSVGTVLEAWTALTAKPRASHEEVL